MVESVRLSYVLKSIVCGVFTMYTVYGRGMLLFLWVLFLLICLLFKKHCLCVCVCGGRAVCVCFCVTSFEKYIYIIFK